MSFAVNYHHWIADEFKPYLGQNAIEVGAGKGDFSRILLGTSIKRLYALEPSTNLFSALQDNLGGQDRATLANNFLEDFQPADPVDSVLYVNVLEHIEDDRKELFTAREKIRPGGHLLLFVPALAWLFSETDRQVGHFRRYEKKSLENLASEAGFMLVKSRYFDIAGIVPWYINCVLLKRSLAAAGVTLYDRLVVPSMRFVECRIRPPVGKNILLVARKLEEQD